MTSTSLTAHRERALSRSVALPALICALFFMSGVGQTAIVPLLPHLADRYGLSASATALLLTLPGLSMLAVSVPVGIAADRFGARRVTLAAGALMALSALAQAVPSLAVLLVGRVVFGIAFGTLWTSGAAWLSHMADGGDGHGSSRVGAAVVISSVGTMVGPGIGGVLAQGSATAIPFTLIGAVTAAVLAPLVMHPPDTAGDGPTTTNSTPAKGSTADVSTAELAILAGTTVTPESLPEPSPAEHGAPLRGLVRDARHPRVAAASGSLVVAGALSGVTQLLISAGLHDDGVSTGEIGLAFSACAIGYILVSMIVVRLGARAGTPRVNALATAVGAVSLVPALISTDATVLVIALLLTAVPRGAINVVAYEVAAGAGRRGGSVFGMINGAWAAATVLMPLAAGTLVQHDGARAGYLAVIVPGMAIAAALVAGLRAAEQRPARAWRRWPVVRYRDVCRDSEPTGPTPSARSTWSRRSSSSGM